MKKRILTLVAITALFVTSFAGCSAKYEEDEIIYVGSYKEQTIDPDAAPEEYDEENDAASDEENMTQGIAFGGDFSRDGGFLSFYMTETGWYLVGEYTPKGFSEDSVFLSGPVDYKEGTSFFYAKDGDELTFTFDVNSVSVTVDKGETYAGFEGEYSRNK